MTRFGNLEIKRAYYSSKQDGKGVYLLDKYIGLDSNEKVSLAAKAHSLREAVETSYRKGGEEACMTDDVVTKGKVCPIYDCVINNKCMPTLVPCRQLGTLGLVAQNLDEYMKPTNTWMTMVWISMKICFPGQTSCRQNAESNLNDMPLFGAVAYVGVPTMERLQCIYIKRCMHTF